MELLAEVGHLVGTFTCGPVTVSMYKNTYSYQLVINQKLYDDQLKLGNDQS